MIQGVAAFPGMKDIQDQLERIFLVSSLQSAFEKNWFLIHPLVTHSAVVVENNFKQMYWSSHLIRTYFWAFEKARNLLIIVMFLNYCTLIVCQNGKKGQEVRGNVESWVKMRALTEKLHIIYIDVPPSSRCGLTPSHLHRPKCGLWSVTVSP